MILYLGACVGCRTDPEAVVLVKNYSVEQVAFSSSVHTGDSDYGNWLGY